MSETTVQDLSGVAETLLITLYIRAMESQRPDALLKDEKAVALVKKISDDGLYDFDRVKSLHLSEANKLVGPSGSNRRNTCRLSHEDAGFQIVYDKCLVWGQAKTA